MTKDKKNTQQKYVTLELSAVKVEQLSKQPIIESSMSLSEDKKWLIHKTIITDIKPMSYMDKVLRN